MSETTTPTQVTPERIHYGPGKDQWADLYLPAGKVRAVVVIIHGGFWRNIFGADLSVPEAEDLVARGFAVLNVEYRRVSTPDKPGDGGWPQTGEDVLAAIRSLDKTPVAGLPVVLLGHSAGGQLAVWAAGHTNVAGVVSQAGPLDLLESDRLGVGDGAGAGFLGGSAKDVPENYRQADPSQNVPLKVPVIALHSKSDEYVPYDLSVRYVDAARKAGAKAKLVETEGGHIEMINPGTPAYQQAVDAINAILDGSVDKEG